MATTTTLDREAYEQYRAEMRLHCCEGLELSYAEWCAACRGES
jgi:hypothetical protein